MRCGGLIEGLSVCGETFGRNEVARSGDRTQPGTSWFGLLRHGQAGEALFEEVFVGEHGLIRGDADFSGRCGEGETDLSVVGGFAKHDSEN